MGMREERQWPPLVPPRLILFDLDDTLCDYAGARDLRLRQAFGPAIAQAGIVPPLDIERMIADSLAIHPHSADHFPVLFERHGIGDPTLAETAAAWYRTNRFYGLKLFADAAPLLVRLRQIEPRPAIGVVTNGPAEVQRAKVELLAIERYVDFIIISGEFGHAKPEPEIFAEALRLGGAKAEEAILIGDSIDHDIAGAHAAGIRSIWLNCQQLPWPGPDASPDHVARDLAQVAAMLIPSAERRGDVKSSVDV